MSLDRAAPTPFRADDMRKLSVWMPKEHYEDLCALARADGHLTVNGYAREKLGLLRRGATVPAAASEPTVPSEAVTRHASSRSNPRPPSALPNVADSAS